MKAAAADTPRTFGVGGEAAVGIAVVAGRTRRQHVELAQVQARWMVLGLGDELGASGGVPKSKKLLLHRVAAELAQAGLPSKGVRLWRPKRTPTPRAVVCGRTQPPRESPPSRTRPRGGTAPASGRTGPGRRSPAGRTGGTPRPSRPSPPAAPSGPRCRARRGADARTRRRCRPNTSAKAYNSSGVAHVPGTGRPSGTVCKGAWSKAQRARLHGLVHQFDHGGDVLVGRRRVVHAALAHGVLAHGAVPHHAPTFGPLGSRSIVSRYSPYETQSQGRPSRMASRGCPRRSP